MVKKSVEISMKVSIPLSSSGLIALSVIVNRVPKQRSQTKKKLTRTQEKGRLRIDHLINFCLGNETRSTLAVKIVNPYLLVKILSVRQPAWA